jgi:hypothetical protein
MDTQKVYLFLFMGAKLLRLFLGRSGQIINPFSGVSSWTGKDTKRTQQQSIRSIARLGKASCGKETKHHWSNCLIIEYSVFKLLSSLIF